MRVDMEQVLNLLKESAKGSELYKRFRLIYEWEKYTLLMPPYEGNDVKKLFLRAQRELNADMCAEYFLFLQCCDGGLLFTNHLYGILEPEDEESDLVYVNTYLREEERIPAGTVAIGCTNYGAYILIDANGKKNMSIWDPEEEEYVNKYPNLYAWLDDMIEEAKYLLQEDALFEIEDDDEEYEDDYEEADEV